MVKYLSEDEKAEILTHDGITQYMCAGLSEPEVALFNMLMADIVTGMDHYLTWAFSDFNGSFEDWDQCSKLIQ